MLGDGEENPRNGERLEDGALEEEWRGCSMAEIYRNLSPFELDHVPPVEPAETHTVLHHFPITEEDNQPPRPFRGHPKWDDQHVKLPCSPKCKHSFMGENGLVTESRWQRIKESLLYRPIRNSHDLQAAILSYNKKYEDKWSFRTLHKFFEDEHDEEEAKIFFENLLPRIIRLALRLPQLIQAPIPLLRQCKCHAITLTQEQISCLLANAFLCTFPRRNTTKPGTEYCKYPDINFSKLFQSMSPCVVEKIKCICHYFRRVCPINEDDRSNVPTGCVTFERRYISRDGIPNWAESKVPLGITPLHITSEGNIEDQGLGLLQVDFANKYLGGGVLGHGCVQEEIRFVICPELIASKLFTEYLKPTEALIMIGSERFSNYTGYADTFQWHGNHEDNTPRDSSRRRMCHIVAIDAVDYNDFSHQYNETLMLREMNKAYVGFFTNIKTLAPGVATGNWGCGAFHGDPYLKALLQIMVCTATNRPLVYYTFGNKRLRDDVHRMHTFFIENNILVKDLWTVLRKFQESQLAPQELYAFLYSELEKLKRSQQPNKNETNQPNKNVKKKTTTTLNSMSITQRPLTNRSPTSNAKRSLEESQDIFASSSPECEDSEAIKTVDLSKSSNSEVDEMLKTQEHEAKKKPTPKKSLLNSGSPAKTAAKPRQRTLLEMLDLSYNQPGPATKKYCTSK